MFFTNINKSKYKINKIPSLAANKTNHILIYAPCRINVLHTFDFIVLFCFIRDCYHKYIYRERERARDQPPLATLTKTKNKIKCQFLRVTRPMPRISPGDLLCIWPRCNPHVFLTNRISRYITSI